MMSLEQAIEKLNDIRCHVKETSAEEQALVMAINALKAQLSQEGTTKGTTSDLISRQAARHALCKAVHKDEDVPCDNQTGSCLWTGTRVCDYVREIDALPSVQPERAEGHWINGKCDRCGEHAPFWAMASTYHESNYCPNCGAKMKGETT